MTASSDMLKKLASGVRPGPAGASGLTPRSPADAAKFEDLLASARAGSAEGIGGGYRSEPVRLAKGSRIELAPDQLRRLGPAVDSAAAQGSHTLLAFIDGQGVIVDVASRTVSGIAKPGDGVVAGVDAVAVVPGAPAAGPGGPSDESGSTGPAGPSAAAAPTAVSLPLPSTESIRNADLSRLLSSLGRGAAETRGAA